MLGNEFIALNSSNLLGCKYDRATQVLTVQFREGAVYDYANVPYEVYEGLMNAGSKGQYFHRHIKARYDASPA